MTKGSHNSLGLRTSSFQSSRFARGSYFYLKPFENPYNQTSPPNLSCSCYSYFCANPHYTYSLCSSSSRTYPTTYTRNSCFVARASSSASNPTNVMPQLPSYLYLKKSTPQAPTIRLLFYFDYFEFSFSSILRLCATANHQTP